jgi:hypothetical protein
MALGRVTATPINTAAREMTAKSATVLKASWLVERDARGTARAKCSEVF